MQTAKKDSEVGLKQRRQPLQNTNLQMHSQKISKRQDTEADILRSELRDLEQGLEEKGVDHALLGRALTAHAAVVVRRWRWTALLRREHGRTVQRLMAWESELREDAEAASAALSAMAESFGILGDQAPLRCMP